MPKHSKYGNQKVLYFTGLDGSGKTLYAKKTMEFLETKGIKTWYTWLRFNHFFTKPLLALCRLTGLTRYEHVNGYRIGYHEFYKSRPVSFIFTCLQWLDTVWASLWKVYIPLFLGYVVICDRYIYDIIIDIAVDTGRKDIFSSPAYNRFLSIMPANTTIFLMQRKMEDVYIVRPEMFYDKTKQTRQTLYNEIAKYQNIHVINNNDSIENVFEKIKHWIKI